MSPERVALLRRAVRFLVVGGAAFCVYLATMWAVVGQMHRSAPFGAVVAFSLSTAVSYVGNTIWSFEAPLTAATAWRFLVIVLAGLAANVAIAAAMQRLQAGYALISVVVFATVPVLNFVGHQFWTFRVRASEPGA